MTPVDEHQEKEAKPDLELVEGRSHPCRSVRKIDERTKIRSSYKERRANALAPGADEGRDKLRKAAVRSKYPTTRRYPNGETRPG